MITSAQMKAARALLGIDQRQLAQRSGLSLPTIQRMEASDGVVRGNVDSLMKLVGALAANGIELIGEGSAGQQAQVPTRMMGPTSRSEVMFHFVERCWKLKPGHSGSSE